MSWHSSKWLLRKLLQTETNDDDKNDDNEVENEEEPTTTTKIGKAAKKILTTLAAANKDDDDDDDDGNQPADTQAGDQTSGVVATFEKGKEHLENMSNMITDVSEKTNGWCRINLLSWCFFFFRLFLINLANNQIYFISISRPTTKTTLFLFLT